LLLLIAHHAIIFNNIRECGSVLYLGMATEILNLPQLCITQIMAKEATNPKPSMQREWYCLAVHKYNSQTYLWVRGSCETDRQMPLPSLGPIPSL